MRRSLASALGIAMISLGTVTLPCPALQRDGQLNGVAVGGSIDRFFYEDVGITAVSFHYSQLRPHRIGSEIGAALFPDALSAGGLLVAPDLGGAFNAPGRDFSLLAKGGVSALLGLGGAFVFYPGFHFGGGVVVRTGNRSGFRLDVVRHVYVSGEGSEGLWSVGLGFTGLPRKAGDAPPTSVKEQ